MKYQRDLRSSPRYPGQTLLLELDGELYPFIDISIGGFSFEGQGFRKGQTFAARISSVLDGADDITALCRVVNVCNFKVCVQFTNPNFQLLKYVIAHIGNVTETTPYVLRKEDHYLRGR